MKFPFHVPSTGDFDVVAFGTNAVDHLIRVDAYPAYGSKSGITGYTQSAGGEAASTAVGLRRLGLTTAYAGRFGDDGAGELGLASLVEEGVDVTYAETVPGAETQIAFIVIDDRTGERTIIWRRDRKLEYNESEPPVAATARCRILHMTPHDTAACLTLARAAKAAGCIISLDVDKAVDGIEDLLPLVDIFIASTDLIREFLGIKDNAAALREIDARFGCRVAGMTLGADGSLFLCSDRIIETPGLAVPGGCVDTTGAGDAFRTGFLYGVLTGREVEECALLANAVAALKCRGAGARSALPFKKELDDLVNISRH